jgi:hypothetical protein
MINKSQEELKKQADLHTAGAIVRHASPFENLQFYRNETPLSAEFIIEWIVPYYMTIACFDKDWIIALQNVKPNITKDICWRLLGDFNWRSRLVGAYFAGVKGYTDMIDTVGIHLLKSEVCCVGHIYALTLAFFNTPESGQFLDTYLDYYLTKPNLYFDQNHVMAALLYLDKVNESHKAGKHVPFFQHLMRTWKTSEAIPPTNYFDEQIPILKNLSIF